MSFNPRFYNDSPLPLERIYALEVLTKALTGRVDTLEVLWKKIEKIIDDFEETVKEQVIETLTEWKEDGTLEKILIEMGFSELFGSYIDSRIFWRDTFFDCYKYTNPPSECKYSSLQGMTKTPNGILTSFGPGLNVATGYGTAFDNTIVFREFNSLGSLIRESEPLPIDHSNSLTYDSKRNVIYSTNHYNLSFGGGKTFNTLVTEIDYDTLTVNRVFNLAQFTGSYLDSVCYNPDDDTLIGYQASSPDYSPRACVFDISTLNLIKTISLEIPVRDERNNSMSTYIQSLKYQNDLMFAITSFPSNLYVLNMDGELIKSIALDDEIGDLHETEDFDVDDDFNIWYGTHRRWYSRDDISTSFATGYEIVETISTVRFSNLKKSYPKENTSTSTSGYTQIRINPNTTNTIQDGSSKYPCKSFMEAYYVGMSYINSPIHFVIPSDAVGVIPYVEVNNSNYPIYITNQSDNVEVVDNIYILNSVVTFANVHFNHSADFVYYPFSTNGGTVVTANSNVRFTNCDWHNLGNNRSVVISDSVIYNDRLIYNSENNNDCSYYQSGCGNVLNVRFDDLIDNRSGGNKYGTYYITSSSVASQHFVDDNDLSVEFSFDYQSVWHHYKVRLGNLAQSKVFTFSDGASIDLTNDTITIKIDGFTITPRRLLAKIYYNR